VYRLGDTVPVPAKRGDVVCFNINTIHGSYINTTDRPRRLIRVGFRDPQNWQTSGQSFGRPGLVVHGYRDRRDGQQLFKLD
jgi:phytanoyl-CoA hydroxylase